MQSSFNLVDKRQKCGKNESCTLLPYSLLHNLVIADKSGCGCGVVTEQMEGEAVWVAEPRAGFILGRITEIGAEGPVVQVHTG